MTVPNPVQACLDTLDREIAVLETENSRLETEIETGVRIFTSPTTAGNGPAPVTAGRANRYRDRIRANRARITEYRRRREDLAATVARFA